MKRCVTRIVAYLLTCNKKLYRSVSSRTVSKSVKTSLLLARCFQGTAHPVRDRVVSPAPPPPTAPPSHPAGCALDAELTCRPVAVAPAVSGGGGVAARRCRRRASGDRFRLTPADRSKRIAAQVPPRTNDGELRLPLGCTA